MVSHWIPNDHLFISGWDDRKLTRLNINTKAVEWTVQGKYQSRRGGDHQ